MTMAEAGLRVRPNLSRFSGPPWSGHSDNITELKECHIEVGGSPYLQRHKKPSLWIWYHQTLRDQRDNVNFESIDYVSLATIGRVLRRQNMRMKQVYRVPFERNKDLRYEYVQRILQFDAMARPHEYLFLDEADFNLQKRRQRGHNIIGQRAITEGLLLFVRPWVRRGL